MARTRPIDLRTPVDDLEVSDDDPEGWDAADDEPAEDDGPDEASDDASERPRLHWRRFLLTVVVCGLAGWVGGTSSAGAQVDTAQLLAARALAGQERAEQRATAATQAQQDAEAELAAAQQQVASLTAQLRARAKSSD